MDASVTPLRHPGLCLVQTTDFFYPLVDDPYMQGCKQLTFETFDYYSSMIILYLMSSM